jgi:hypothetical protein
VASISEDNGISEVVRRWQGEIVDDGSLPDGGFEINTAPASGDLFLKQIAELGTALSRSDAEVTSACGLHVHVDARDLKHADIARLMRLYAAFEDLLYSMVPPSRSSGTYSKKCGARFARELEFAGPYYHPGINPVKALKRTVAQAVYGTVNTRDYARQSKPGCRYVGMNVHSWYMRNGQSKRGTIEFRFPSGTVNTNKIQSWGMLFARLVDLATTLTDSQVKTIVADVGTGYDRAFKLMCAFRQFSAHVIKGNVKLAAFVTERIGSHCEIDAVKTLVRGAA